MEKDKKKRKKRLITFAIIVFTLVTMAIGWDLSIEIETSYECLEFVIPLFYKRDVTTLSYNDFFDYEKLEKIYLTKWKTKQILKKIEKNGNWTKGEIDKKVEERLKFYTREDIYNKIPYIENKYWVFVNRGRGVNDKHSIDEIRVYYAISFAVLDIDNNILYYYEYED